MLLQCQVLIQIFLIAVLEFTSNKQPAQLKQIETSVRLGQI